MNQNPLMAELSRIEQEAAGKTKMLLDHQDAFLRGHELAELLKAHGAPNGTELDVVYYSGTKRPIFIIYATSPGAESDAAFHAVQDSRVPYQIGAGHADEIRYLRVEGFEGCVIALPASIFLQAA